jgi:acetyl-CoA carboxylase carboxyl transferase subunit alpha
MASEAAEQLGLTAHRLKSLGLIDKIVNEPVGGAHRDYVSMCGALKKSLAESLRQFSGMSVKELLERRHERLMSYGKFKDTSQK